MFNDPLANLFTPLSINTDIKFGSALLLHKVFFTQSFTKKLVGETEVSARPENANSNYAKRPTIVI